MNCDCLCCTLTQGPVSSKDLETRERLNRPVINVMQRHPGNQMPEAQYIVRVRTQRDASAAVCRYNWHSAGSLGWTFPVLKYKCIFKSNIRKQFVNWHWETVMV